MQKLETKILRIFRGKYGRYTATLELHPTDLTPELTELLYAMADTGASCEMVISAQDDTGIPASEPEKPKQSIYQWFKWQIEELGMDYEKEKVSILSRFGFATDHMRNLESSLKKEEIELLLKDRIYEIKQSLGLFNIQV